LTTPESLGDGLIMRRATLDDVEALCAFNGEIFRESSRSEPNEWVQTWTRDLMTRQHPTFKVDDFLIVEDTRTKHIISSLCLISQTWSYGGVEFGVGLPELVGTDPAYRRRGLIRRQFDVIHRWSAERGQLVQAISGIPWFYRQFGYEMTLEHNTGRVLARYEVPKLTEGKAEPYHVRPARPDDVPFIADVDRQGRDRYLVTAVRDETLWRLELDGRHERFGPALAIVESAAGDPIGFVAHAPLRRGNRLVVYVVELRRGASWLNATPTVLRYLAQRGAALPTRRGDDEPFEVLAFALGTLHPIYRVAGNSMRVFREYAYYIRVPDLPVFIRRIAPVLERRLADSIAAGYSGELQLSFYRSGLVLHFDHGQLADVSAFDPPQDLDSGASFPDLTFLQLLFGWRSRAEIEGGYPDCFTSGDEAGVLVDALFPKQPSQVWPIQ
jgi:Acetyltransferase (GNAT) domain